MSSITIKSASTLLGLLAFFVAAPALAESTELQPQDQNTELRIGIRKDAPPFSWVDESSKQNSGYSVKLCIEFAEYLKSKPRIELVDTGDRFLKLQNREIDILCGATTATIDVMERFDVSFYTFITATTFATIHPLDFEKSTIVFGVRSDSTSAEALTDTVSETKLRLGEVLGIDPSRLKAHPVSSHFKAIHGLEKKEYDLYVADKTILTWLSHNITPKNSRLSDQIRVNNKPLVLQPYALILQKCSGLLFKLNKFLKTKFENTAFIDSLIDEFGTGVDLTFLKLVAFQAKIPDGDHTISVNENCRD